MPKPRAYGTRPHALTFHIHSPITLLVLDSVPHLRDQYHISIRGIRKYISTTLTKTVPCCADKLRSQQRSRNSLSSRSQCPLRARSHNEAESSFEYTIIASTRCTSRLSTSFLRNSSAFLRCSAIRLTRSSKS